MGIRHTPKTASCLYMLGFLSGLLFIVLCGSSTIYEEFAASLPKNNSVEQQAPRRAVPPEVPVAHPLNQMAPVLDIDFERSEDGDELTVQGIGFAPAQTVTVFVQADDRTIQSADTLVTDASSFHVLFLLPDEARSLTAIRVTAQSQDMSVTEPYTLPGEIVVGEAVAGFAVTQPESPIEATLPVCTCTPTPTPTRPPPNTAMPTATQTVPPTPTPILQEVFYPNWRAEYFNNPTWTGEPAQIRDDPAITFDWGEDSPVPGAIGHNWFSVRWTRRISLPEGYYNFVLSADDQAEVYMDGRKILSYFGKAPSAVNQASVYVQGPGPTEFVVLFAEYWGSAHVQFYWQPDDGTCCWNIGYFRSANLFGDPLYYESVAEGDVRLDWRDPNNRIWQHIGYNHPFSARITRQLQAPVRRGDYHLCFYIQDSARLWLDRTLLVERRECSARGCLVCNTAVLNKRPLHYLNLEYFHGGGNPYLGMWTLPARAQEPWIGAFFDNPELAGLPLFLQTTAVVAFDWGYGTPDIRLPLDNFSVRWMRTEELSKGQYTFHVVVDDGVRLRVNNRVILDEWIRGSAREFVVPYDVLAEKEITDIELDYFEAGEQAVAKIWWDPPSTATATLTPTPIPTFTPSTTPTRTPSPTPTPCCVTPIPCVPPQP